MKGSMDIYNLPYTHPIRRLDRFYWSYIYWPIRAFFQRRIRGFDDCEIWDLGPTTLPEFMIPRLKCLKEMVHGYPPDLNSSEEWKTIIDKMILGFETLLEDDHYGKDTKNAIIEEGLDLFRKYLRALWD